MKGLEFQLTWSLQSVMLLTHGNSQKTQDSWDINKRLLFTTQQEYSQHIWIFALVHLISMFHRINASTHNGSLYKSRIKGKGLNILWASSRVTFPRQWEVTQLFYTLTNLVDYMTMTCYRKWYQSGDGQTLHCSTLCKNMKEQLWTPRTASPNTKAWGRKQSYSGAKLLYLYK
jgi:hypothetical protein